MKRLLLFFSFLTIVLGGYADDGGARNVEDWTYGNIYVKEPNEKIALEKELMVCDLDSVTATFIFKNTTSDTVSVDCAFPIDVKVPFSCEEHGRSGEVSMMVKEWNYSCVALRMLLGTKDTFRLEEVLDDEGKISLNNRVRKLVQKHDKELRVMKYDSYNRFLDEVSRSEYEKWRYTPSDYVADDWEYYPYARTPYRPQCVIEQDGKSVAIQNVGIESSVSENEFAMKLHFHHELKFMPDAYSKVIVKYHVVSVDSIGPGDEGSYCSYMYDISTGGTWKGNIHSFVLVSKNCKMRSFSKNHKNTNFNCLSRERWRCGIYSKKEYKPQKGDYFMFNWHETLLPLAPAFDELHSAVVENVRTSSSWLNVGALTDKNPTTSCVIPNWRNTSVEFTLKEDAMGPFLCNGECYPMTKKQLKELKDSLKMQDVVNWYYNSEIFFFEEHSWVKRIMMESLDRPSDTFLYDAKHLKSGDYPRVLDWERIDAVSGMTFFPAGRYRFSIKDCYSGCEKPDTAVISELWFLPTGDLPLIMEEDKKSPFPIFQHLMDSIKVGSWEDNGEFVYETSAEDCIDCESQETESDFYDNESDSILESEHLEIQQCTYRNASENTAKEAEESQDSFPIGMIILGAVGVLCLVGGVVCWKRKP